MEEFIRQLANLQKQVDGLIKPELGRWVSLTPTVYQNGAVAATVEYAKYFLVNRKITIVIGITITAAGSAGNPVYILVPSTDLTPTIAAATYSNLGSYNYIDTGTNIYHGYASYGGLVTGLPAIGGFAHAAGGGFIGQTPSLATANGDFVGINVTYEI